MMTQLIRYFFALLVLLFGLISSAETEIQKLERITNKSIEYFNNEKYNDALILLESIKSSNSQYINWYYYYALNHARLDNYEEAIKNFETYIKKADISQTAKAYYYIGLIQFKNGEYEKALNSLDLAMDVSKDPRLDQMIETLIEKTIRYQNYYEVNKKTNLIFLLGYDYDTDVIELSPDFFEEKLSGHVLNYGVSISHRFIDGYSYVLEPALAILDEYSLDSSFKQTSTIQSTDSLQLLLSVPIRFYFENEPLSNKFDISLNGYSVYLPLTTEKRELSQNSYFLLGRILSPLSASKSINYNLMAAANKSYGFTSDDDDDSGQRFEFLGTFINYPSEDRNNNIFFDLGVDYNFAKGSNARYKKYSAAAGYMHPSLMQSTGSVRLAYYYMNYPDKTAPRTDNQVSLAYYLGKGYSGGSYVDFTLAGVMNNSNSELNKYSDVVFGIQYSKTLAF